MAKDITITPPAGQLRITTIKPGRFKRRRGRGRKAMIVRRWIKAHLPEELSMLSTRAAQVKIKHDTGINVDWHIMCRELGRVRAEE
jgi:hypothetical protein